ncbi:AAA family ATPase [Thalassotalea crassostreae]|uniref:AAA family ATPase n=1 Tax=Thalassotalea crassostreae TaxID=1763536 RepID=UPI000B1DA1CA
MKKIVIFGNSGSGKSTLARQLSSKHNLPHFDLDTIAWEPVSPPQRMSIDKSSVLIEQFVNENEQWIIEGCYSDLIELVLPKTNQVIF